MLQRPIAPQLGRALLEVRPQLTLLSAAPPPHHRGSLKRRLLHPLQAQGRPQKRIKYHKIT